MTTYSHENPIFALHSIRKAQGLNTTVMQRQPLTERNEHEDEHQNQQGHQELYPRSY